MVIGGHAPRAGSPAPPRTPLLVVDARHDQGRTLSRALFGLGVDVPDATYTLPQDTRCQALPGVGHAVTLVRVGAATADDYDWSTDSYVPAQGGPARRASIGCPTPYGRPGATVLRVLDRVRMLRATAVVVLNGEIDDPQGAAGLVRLIAGRYGLRFARDIYWEIGAAPATWQSFGLPLSARHVGDHITCSPDQYAALVTSYEAAIEAALDTHGSTVIPRIVADDWITNATDQSWTGVVTAVDTQYYPFDSPDSAPASPAAIAASISAHPSPDAIALAQQLQSLRANLAQYSGGSAIRLFVGQWNIDRYPTPTNPWYNSPAQAVFVARVLLHLAQQNVSMAAWAPPLYGATAFGSTQAPFVDGRPGPGYHVFATLRDLAGARLLPIVPEGVASAAPLDYLAVRGQDGRVTIVLVNAGGRRALSVSLRVRGGPPHPVDAFAQTFAPGTPDGASAARPFLASGTRMTVPPLGVVVLGI